MSTEDKKNIFNEGKYTLFNFTMSTPNGEPIELSSMAVTCDIYESILSPSIIMIVKLYDATGAFSSFDWVSQEICLSFTTNSRGTPIHYKLGILEMHNASEVSEGRGVVFELVCVSAEAEASKIAVNRTNLTKKKIEADRMVGVCLDELMKVMKEDYGEKYKPKPQFFDKTKGLADHSYSNTNVFEAIQLITRKAVSSDYEGHAFVFYENHKGYWFKCIESLIKEGKKNIGDKVFFNTSMAKVDSTASLWRNIISSKPIQLGSKNVTLAIGANKVQIIPMPIGLSNDDDDYPQPFERSSKDYEFVTLNDGTAVRSQTVEDKLSKDRGSQIKIEYNPETEDTTQFEKEAAIRIYLAQFLSVIQHINIYGDSEITCGEVIKCNFKENKGLTPGAEEAQLPDDPVLSGNYLVTKCRHSLTFGDTPEYYQTLEIIKDGIVSNLEPIKI